MSKMGLLWIVKGQIVYTFLTSKQFKVFKGKQDETYDEPKKWMVVEGEVSTRGRFIRSHGSSHKRSAVERRACRVVHSEGIWSLHAKHLHHILIDSLKIIALACLVSWFRDMGNSVPSKFIGFTCNYLLFARVFIFAYSLFWYLFCQLVSRPINFEYLGTFFFYNK